MSKSLSTRFQSLTSYFVWTALMSSALLAQGPSRSTGQNPFKAPARLFHLSPFGNDANPGTLALPWRTIAKANQELRAGDTVLLHAGSYDDPIRPFRSGRAHGVRIEYRAFGDGDVFLTGFFFGGGTWEGALGLGDRDYITVSGRAYGDPQDTRRIHLVPSAYVDSYGNVCGSEGVIVENIEMVPGPGGVPSRGFSFGTNFWSFSCDTRFCVLRNCRIVGVSSMSQDPLDFTEDVVTIGKAAHHNLIENNVLETCKHTALYADAPGAYSNVIRNNVIRNPQHTALSIHSAGVQLQDGARFLVEGNWLEASGRTNNPDGFAGNAFQWGSDELIIRYNVITQGGSANGSGHNTTIGGLIGATSTSFGFPYFATDGRVYHNTIVKNRGAALGLFDFGVNPVDLGRNRYVNNFFYDSNSNSTGGLLALYWDAGFDTADRFVSNVFGNPGGSPSEIIVSTGKQGFANLATAIQSFSNPQDPELTPWAGFSNRYDAAPGFRNYAADDYRLASSSPYIDGGAPLTRTASAGSGTQLAVEDARVFFAEAIQFPSWMAVQTEWIAVGSSLAGAERVQIAAVDDQGGLLRLRRSITWSAGDFVWLWRDSDGRQRIHGAAPDIGAFEREP